jgi:carbamoyltransferase
MIYGVNYIMAKFNIGVYGSHNSALAISFGGDVLEVVELERWVGIKNAAFFYYFPIDNSMDVLDNILNYFENKYGAKEYDYAMVNSWPEEHKHKLRASNVIWIPHHIAHVSNVQYQSESKKALNISFDGGSDNGHFNIYLSEKGVEPILIFNSEQDICVPYATLAHYIPEIKREENLWVGNLVYSGKLMGLSSYGKRDDKFLKTVESFFDQCNTNEVDIAHKKWVDIYCACLQRGEDGRNLAWAAQKAFELKFAELALSYILKYQDIELQFSGGGSMNIINNTLYKAFVSPNSDDRGIALGCLLYLLKPQTALDSTYLGSAPYDEKPKGEPHSIKQVAHLLEEGKIIGLIQGRGEHGARSLGNRSILCLPTEGMKDRLNKEVKFREEYRPFAAVCREEDVNKYFYSIGNHRWMTNNAVVKTNDLPAITHIDRTCRLQTVTEKQNPFLYQLLGEHPVLLNTSFNIQGKPILNTYKDALWMKENTGIDEVITNIEIL